MKKHIQNTLLVSFIAAQGLILAACGGGSTGSAPANNPPSADVSPTANSFAYIKNYAAGKRSLTSCSITTDGAFTNCNIMSGTESIDDNPQFTPNHNIVAYTMGTQFLTCQVNHNDGSFNNCAVVPTTSTFTQPFVSGISKNYVYVTDVAITGEETWYTCPITSSGVSGACNVGYGMGGNAWAGFSFNASYTRFYTANYHGSENGSVMVCDISPTNGTPSNCHEAIDNTKGNIFNHTAAVTFNPKNGLAYVVNTGNTYLGGTVSICQIDAATGDFSSCKDSGATGLSYSYQIAFDSTGKLAYVTNSDDTMNNVSVFNVDQATGALSIASPQYTGSNLAVPTGIAIN